MVYYKTSDEIEIIRQNCLLVSKTLALVASLLKPGVTGSFLDAKAEEFIRDHNGALPGFKGYHDFPATLCISPNQTIVHGIPSTKEFVEGDIVSVDCGVFHNDFYGDAAFTFALGEISEEVFDLLVATNESLYKGIEMATVGARLGDIGWAVQEHTEKRKGYGVVRELVGHGLGRKLHEKPEVPNYGRRGKGIKLKQGLVIAIEPMVNLGTKAISHGADGWTIDTADKLQSAHYEHTIAVTKDGPDILSDHSFIFEQIKNNKEIVDISIKK